MKVVEVYTSIQGEGPNVGEPTTFVRFGGCNLRCAGWGTGTLPNGSTIGGCDTTFAVYPEWRDTWGDESVDSLLDRIPRRPTRICLTGGEPLIQPSRELNQLVDSLIVGRYQTIDLFTNGTKLIPDWATQPRVTVVMDWKLMGSGEGNRFNKNNLERIREKDAIKFVCKDEADFWEAVALIEAHNLNSFVDIYFGVVWDSQFMEADILGRGLTNAQLVELMLENISRAKLSVQMHNHIWPPNERGR